MHSMLALVALIGGLGSVQGGQQILPKTTQKDAFFGTSVSVSGDTAIVGAPNEFANGLGVGAVHMFNRIDTTWAFQQKLFASDPGAGDFYGQSVSILYDSLIVGAPRDDNNGQTNSGAAYIYNKNHFDGKWQQKMKLVDQYPQANGNVGHAVAMHKDWAFIGAPGKNNNRGTVVVAHKSSSGSWRRFAEWICPVGGTNRFGSSIAVSGDHLIIGAPAQNGGVGAVYIYTETTTSWTYRKIIHPVSPQPNLQFGASVAITSGTIVIGQPGANSNAGRVTIFMGYGTIWSTSSPIALIGSTFGGVQAQRYGSSVAIDGKTLVVGAPEYRSQYTWSNFTTAPYGQVYLYTRHKNNIRFDLTWVLAGSRRYHSKLGSSVCVFDDNILTGAPRYSVVGPVGTNNSGSVQAYSYMAERVNQGLGSALNSGSSDSTSGTKKEEFRTPFIVCSVVGGCLLCLSIGAACYVRRCMNEKDYVENENEEKMLGDNVTSVANGASVPIEMVFEQSDDSDGDDDEPAGADQRDV